MFIKFRKRGEGRRRIVIRGGHRKCLYRSGIKSEASEVR